MDPDQEIAELRARADAGDRNAAGRLGELLAERGDREGAVRVWQFSDVIWRNPAGFHSEHLHSLSPEDFLQETTDDPEDWVFMETERLARVLAERGDDAALAELRARAEAGDPAAAKRLAG